MLLLFFLYTLLSLSGNSGCLTWIRRQQPQEQQRYPVLQVHAGSFLFFHNAPNCDMDYKVFNVRTRAFLCIRVHTGVGHTDESAQHFWLETLSQICLVFLTVFEHRVFGSQVQRSTNWATPSPPPNDINSFCPGRFYSHKIPLLATMPALWHNHSVKKTALRQVSP